MWLKYQMHIGVMWKSLRSVLSYQQCWMKRVKKISPTCDMLSVESKQLFTSMPSWHYVTDLLVFVHHCIRRCVCSSILNTVDTISRKVFRLIFTKLFLRQRWMIRFRSQSSRSRCYKICWKQHFEGDVIQYSTFGDQFRLYSFLFAFASSDLQQLLRTSFLLTG